MELWDIYDEAGNRTGKTKPKGSPMEPGEYHLSMEAWIMNREGKLLLQLRAPGCDILPSTWSLTTGRMIAGEDTRTGCIRELKEELGLTVAEKDVTFLRRLTRRSRGLLWDAYLVRADVPLEEIVLQEEEVSEAAWITIEEYQKKVLEGAVFAHPQSLEIAESLKAFRP